MDEPATEMDVMDSGKDSRGLDHGLKKAIASDLIIILITCYLSTPY